MSLSSPWTNCGRLLFDQEQRQKQVDLDAVTDQIRERFGSSAVRRGASPRHSEDDE